MFYIYFLQSTVKQKTEDLESSVRIRDELKTQLESITVSLYVYTKWETK